ncbi:MAG: PIN domain-containing protein [Opitutus sp.]|nr:PIN domain-containing protein [Opitutus sp.]
MTTAIDSSVLWAIAKGEADGSAWLEMLAKCREEGRLVICETVWAETRAAFPSAAAHAGYLERLGVHFDAANVATANLAGEIHDRFRRAGGRRIRLTADFLIGAHAALQANRLATKDDGFFREQFRRLKVERPPIEG